MQAASNILYELSGRQWPGWCQDTVRPCPQNTSYDGGRPLRGSGYGICSCSSPCRCGSNLHQVSLGANPVVGIVQVRIDGEVLDSSLYRVDEGRWLVRLRDADGSNPGWPSQQILDLPDTEVGTWSVTLVYGAMPPVDGIRAAARLGCELALMCSPETIGACQLPQGITSVARQGVDMVVLDPGTIDRAILASLPECRIFLETRNPANIRRQSVVMSPDIHSKVRRVGA